MEYKCTCISSICKCKYVYKLIWVALWVAWLGLFIAKLHCCAPVINPLVLILALNNLLTQQPFVVYLNVNLQILILMWTQTAVLAFVCAYYDIMNHKRSSQSRTNDLDANQIGLTNWLEK